MGAIHHPFQAHDHSGDLLHPGAPAGGCGPGASRVPGPVCGSHSTASLPHVDSPAARHLNWQGALHAIALPSRAAAVYRAIQGASAYIGNAIFQATGQELEQIVAGILPGVLMLMAVLAAATALGAAAGAAIGALAFGAGAVPGAAIGGELGLDAGIALLDFLGVAFLAVYIGRSLIESTKIAGHAVVRAWESVDQPRAQQHAWVDQASHMLAAAVAELFRGVLQGIVAFLLAKGTSAAAGRLPELSARLRASKLGAGFAEWVERNWSALIENPKLKVAPPQVGTGQTGQAAAPAPLSSPRAAKAKEPASEAAPPLKPAVAPAAPSYLKPPLPKTVLEPGAVPGPASPTLNPMPEAVAGFPRISQSEVNTFTKTPTAELIPEGTKLYRMVGEGSNPAGAFWTREMPATEAQWRSASAVKGEWNGDGGVVEYTVPPGGLPAWTGEAAPQPAALPGYILRGGGDQVVVPANSIIPSAPKPTPWGGG